MKTRLGEKENGVLLCTCRQRGSFLYCCFVRFWRWMITAGILFCGSASAQDEAESLSPEELQASAEQHMRDELGVNDITTPSIAQILRDLGAFHPVPLDLIAQNNRDASYPNRMQTALHFGSLVADGFMLTLAKRPREIQEVGKALLRQSQALGVGERLARRSKSLLELSEREDWEAMQGELIRAQGDVETSMLELRDEEMAHMVSLGGWLRGFQLAARSASQNYSAQRAEILGRAEIMDYYLDRLETLHPRLRKTEFASELTARIRKLREMAVEAGGRPSAEQVRTMSALADEAVAIALGPVDAEGKILNRPST